MKKTFYYSLLFLVLIIQYGCKDNLNALPTQAKVEGNVIVDQKSAEVALNGAYARLANVGTSLSAQSTIWPVVHEIYPGMLAGWMQYGFSAMPEQNNLTPPNGGIANSLWTPNFSILNAANGVIDGVSALQDGKFTGMRKQELLAEARFLRAYAHHNLLRYYSVWNNINSPYGVLLRKTSLRLSNAAQSRSSVKESYDFILEDLDFAIANASDTRPNYYANKIAAKALKLRVLMIRGQAGDFTAAITLANEIIANANYNIEPSLRDLMQVKGLTSKEVIFGVTPFANQNGRRSQYEYVQSAVFLSTPQFRKLLQNDPRASWMLTKATTSTLALIRDSTYMSKFFGAKVEDVYLLRLSEVHLTKAEALLRSGGSVPEAKIILKNIMSKAGVTNFTEVDNANTAADLLLQLYYEYARNLSMEDGIELSALYRLPLQTITSLRPNITQAYQLYLPIPFTEFQLNPSIGDQNPGYPRQVN